MKSTILYLIGILIQIYQSPLFAQVSHNNWSVYFGGNNNEYTEEVAADHEGNVIIAGKTKSNSGIATPGAYQEEFGGGPADAFIAKYDSAGNLLWSTYLGGPMEEYAYAVSVDVNNNIYVGGRTKSTTGIATPGAYQTIEGGNNDGFIAKFSKDGAMLWSTYFGRNNGEWVLTLANDPQGNVYAAGYTGSKGLATPGAYQPDYAGGMDCYLAKFNPDGQLLFCTYFGSTGEDRPHDLQIDHKGNVIMIGTTPGGIGMSTPGAFQETSGGVLDAFISKWTSDGQLKWSTLYGGSDFDRARECSIDSANNIYVTGFTSSVDQIATSDAYQPNLTPPVSGKQTYDAYLVKFTSWGNRVWGTYFGGSRDEYGRGVRVTAANTILISGVTSSTSNIASPDGFQCEKKGSNDAYLAEFNDQGNFIGGSYFGGSGSEPYDIGYGPAIDIDAAGNIYMAPSTNSSDVPNAKNSFHPGESENMYDALLTRFSMSNQRLLSGKTSLNEMGLMLYPNPASDVFTISINSAVTGDADVVLSDASGNNLFSFPFNFIEGINEVNVDVKSISSGVYVVSIPGINSGAVKKIIVNH